MNTSLQVTTLENEGYISNEVISSSAYRSLTDDAKLVLLLMLKKKVLLERLSHDEKIN